MLDEGMHVPFMLLKTTSVDCLNASLDAVDAYFIRRESDNGPKPLVRFVDGPNLAFFVSNPQNP